MVARSSRKRMNRRRKTYRKQRGGGLKEDAIAALGTKYPDVLKKDNKKALEDVLFNSGIVVGTTFTEGEFTFQKVKPNHYTYKIKAWKTGDAEETAVEIIEVIDH